LCAALKKAGLLDQVPQTVWKKKWVVHCQRAGRGQKVLEYLGRYVFRVAITNSRLERIGSGEVTYRYRDNGSQEMRYVTVSGVEFIRRFLQHVLPRGFAKVRYYGIWSSSCRQLLNQARTLLTLQSSDSNVDPAINELPAEPDWKLQQPRCPYCKIGHLVQIEIIYPHWRRKPP
jgi:hypothetical protein